jgi:hypothetical protein
VGIAPEEFVSGTCRWALYRGRGWNLGFYGFDQPGFALIDKDWEPDIFHGFKLARYIHIFLPVLETSLVEPGTSRYLIRGRVLHDFRLIELDLLFWGMAARLFGLVIPGCLVVAIAPGIYFAWSSPITGNPLVYTGIMLVWFAFGWGLITLCGRLIIHHFIWWPLIPGGILAMVGCGLYIGGDPGNALNFISNTGSIALVIFGLYLILMRKGIHH